MTYSVTLYLIDRVYGGPEEGGWYFTSGEPQPSEHNRAFATRAEALHYVKSLHSIEDAMNDDRPSINSVLSEGQYAFFVDEGTPAPFPTKRPHYE